MSDISVRITAEVEIDSEDFPGDAEDELDLMAVATAAESQLSSVGVVMGTTEVEYA